MGSYSVGRADVKLLKAGLRCQRGYPGSLMPQITDTVVALNVHKYSPEGIIIEARICTPMNKGVYACEDAAVIIYEAWTEDGGVVTYGDHSFDGKSGLYEMSVFGEWKNTTEETEEAST